MSKSYCGINCKSCDLNKSCCGCIESEGRPFGGTCVIAGCCKDCDEKKRINSIKDFKKRIISEINSLEIPDMPEVKELFYLKGSFVNIEFTLSDGTKKKFWDDDRIYLGAQIEVDGDEKCFGIVADEDHILICKYGCNGKDPEIVKYVDR